MIIDAHSHWLPDEIIKNAHFFHKGWGDIEAHLRMMDEAGIDKAVISYPTSDAHVKLGGLAQVAKIYNNNVAQILKRYPDRFIGAAIVPVGDARAMCDECVRATGELGFQALSLASSYNGMYLDDPSFSSLYTIAQKENIPIFVHSQIINPIGFERVDDPLLTPVIEYVFDTTICIGKLMMSVVLREHSRLKFIFGYFGGVIAHLTHRFDATYQMLRGINFVKDLGALPSVLLKNIYVDTSGDIIKTNFLSARELVGPGHILWGSDWPAKKDVRGSIEAIKQLGISKEEEGAILGNNMINVLGGR